MVQLPTLVRTPTVPAIAGNVIVVESVPASVRVFEAVNVLLAPMLSVPVPDAHVLPFHDVPVATPRTGVTSVGDVAKTSEPEPVSSVIADARFAEDGVARRVATPVPKPEMPVDTGNPVAFVSVAEVGVPSNGVTRVGDVLSTMFPVPVTAFDSVTPPYVSAALSVVAPVTPRVLESVVAPVTPRVVDVLSAPVTPTPVVAMSTTLAPFAATPTLLAPMR